MPYSDTLFLNLLSRVENGLGRLEEGQKQNRMAAEARAEEIHRRIDETNSRVVRLDQKVDQAINRTSVLSFGSVASALISHWQIVATIILIVSGLIMGKSPEVVKGWLKALG